MNNRYESHLDSAIDKINNAKEKEGYARLISLCEAVSLIDFEIRKLNDSKPKYPIGEHTD